MTRAWEGQDKIPSIKKFGCLCFYSRIEVYQGYIHQYWRNTDWGSNDSIFYCVTRDKAFKFSTSQIPLLK